jgi:hypothetical protein
MKLFCYILFPLFAFLSSPTRMSVTSPKELISCAPAGYSIRATIASVQSGNWSNPATWGGRIPAAGDAPLISVSHVVFADVNANIAGMQVAGTLWYDMGNSITITSTQNVLVTGLLQMTPPSPSTIHSLKFAGINENNFAGGGMDPVATDVGLWVMGAGRLQLQGADKTSWTNADGAIAAGATTVIVNNAAGWQPGDELIISPTLAGIQKADNVIINNTDGRNIKVTQTVSSTHPLINNQWTAEVGNLTRNVRIEGTATGRSHIFIRSTSKQLIKNVAFRYLGPRKDQGGSTAKELVLGRYGLHFHHCMDGSDGSIVEGCVMRDIGNHAYVPHVSHGIEMRDNIAYNCTEAPFWWDLPDASHNTAWVHNLVISPQFVSGSINQDTKGSPTFGVHGFVLGMGDDNRCDSNVVAGQVGLSSVTAAYDWEEMPIESAWIFKGNVVHNSDCGIRSWQNNGKNHVLENTTVYNTGVGVFHGAYVNNYTYNGGYLYNAVFEDHAAGAANSVRIENITLDGGGLIDYPFYMTEGPLKGERPVFMRSCTIKGGRKGAIFNESTNALKSLDVVQCVITGGIIISTSAGSGETIRVQPVSGQAYKLTKSGKSNIANFAPTDWGTGTGLQGQYFNGIDFTDLATTRIDPLINFPEWQIKLPGELTGVHNAIKDETYSIRFTGYLEPQFTELYKFSIQTGGGVRLWIDGKLLLDKWSDVYPTTFTSTTIPLQAGKRYSVKLEYLNNDDRSALYLSWQSASQLLQLVPQSQLYPDLVQPPPPPDNQAPTASAGQDETINLQLNLTGSGSDLDGSIVSYKWEQVSGPSCVITMVSTTSAIVTKVQPGTYVFRLTVTDDKGATGTATVTKIIQ